MMNTGYRDYSGRPGSRMTTPTSRGIPSQNTARPMNGMSSLQQIKLLDSSLVNSSGTRDYGQRTNNNNNNNNRFGGQQGHGARPMQRHNITSGNRDVGQNFIWVRTELVEAIWNNRGKLPPGWKPSRKRGRDNPSWGWMRAKVVQSSSSSAPNMGGSSIGQHRLRGNSQGKSILATIKVEDDKFAPNELKNATVSLSYVSGESDMVLSANNWWNSTKPKLPVDLCSLTHLHEPSVVFCLHERYQKDIIYTYTGKILLALNPFRVLEGVYGDAVMQQYWQPEVLERPPPHVYAIAQDAYKSMIEMRKDQSVLVSGESGSGKTVTTKIIMGFLATQSRRVTRETKRSIAKEGVESQILQSNPILESFGNARTIRNDNSSRFGKYMELLFTPAGTLVSASIKTYLLEKVRLITQAPGERNYHIFYELLAGISQKERQLLKIANVTARDFRMTAASGTYDRRDGVQDRETYHDLRQAMDTVGFSKEDQRSIFSVVCALLHTSNIDIQASSGDGSTLVTSNSLRCALSLLGVPQEALNNALCLCAIEARGEVFHKNMSVPQAEKALEALIKATYGALFTHIVKQINRSIRVGDSRESLLADLQRIGVLDIFGFESFDFNSFEQLCINYCNEALQQQFNRFVFKLEQEEYKKEGIDWSFIDFPDNQDILDLIEKKRVGILSILDEHCRLTSQTDASFCRAVYDKCSDHPRFSGSNTQKVNLQFSIKHYAGVVTYDCIIFLEKNKDELPKETTELLTSSSAPFLSYLGELLEETSSNIGSTKKVQSPSSPYSRYGRQNPKESSRGSSSMIRESVGSQFSRQLQELRDRIDSTTPHYVRCLKPNDQLVPHQFQAHVIADQLRCAGVLEAIRVARVGFQHRYFHDQFLERYGMLSRAKTRGPIPVDQRCVNLVHYLEPDVLRVLERETPVGDKAELKQMVSLGMQIGYSKVFLRRRVYEALEFLRNKKMIRSATVIQKYLRRFSAQNAFITKYVAILTLQKFARRIFADNEHRMLIVHEAATKIQSQWRRFLAETELIAARLIAHFCQALVRGAMARRLYGMMRVDVQATIIQTAWRSYINRIIFIDLRRASVIIQCFWRRRVAIDTLRHLRREARNLGTVAKERDLLKEQSRSLQQEVQRLRSGKVSVDGKGEEDDEVIKLRREVERLQAALSAANEDGVSPGSPQTRQGWSLFGKGADTSSQVSTNSFSLPGIKRAFSRSESESPRKSSHAASPNTSIDIEGAGNPNTSLLDSVEDTEMEDYQLRSVANSPGKSSQIFSISTMSPPAESPERINSNFSPLSERRGLDFCRDLQLLHDSIRSNDFPMANKLLREAPDTLALINEADEKGLTALHIAVASENAQVARVLVDKGSFVNAQDYHGNTPLHLVVGAPMTNLLLDVGKANPNIPNTDGVCALHLAVQRKDPASVRLLLKQGAKVNTADNIRWFTPIHLAALPDGSDKARQVDIRARKKIVELLCVASGSSSQQDLNDQDSEGNTPLHYAVQIDTKDACNVINTFLENGADPRKTNKRNQQPLLILCHNNALRKQHAYQECLHSILFHGADPNQQSDTGCTPLHLSLYHKDIDSAVQLIHSGAELHFLWKKPKRWVATWDDMGSSEVLPLDMVEDENTLYRILAAINHPPKWAPARTWCMNCKTSLGSPRGINCRHCGRHVCGACCRTTLAPEFFPKNFEIYEASWACVVCERILVGRKEDNSSGTQPISSGASSVFDEYDRF